MLHPEGSFPHWRELVEALAREYPPQDKVTSLQRPGTDVSAVVAAQPLLVTSRAESRFAPYLLEEAQAIFEELILARLVESKDSRRPMPELGGEDRFSPVDEEEGCFAGRLGRSCAY